MAFTPAGNALVVVCSNREWQQKDSSRWVSCHPNATKALLSVTYDQESTKLHSSTFIPYLDQMGLFASQKYRQIRKITRQGYELAFLFRGKT